MISMKSCHMLKMGVCQNSNPSPKYNTTKSRSFKQYKFTFTFKCIFSPMLNRKAKNVWNISHSNNPSGAWKELTDDDFGGFFGFLRMRNSKKETFSRFLEKWWISIISCRDAHEQISWDTEVYLLWQRVIPGKTDNVAAISLQLRQNLDKLYTPPHCLNPNLNSTWQVWNKSAPCKQDKSIQECHEQKKNFCAVKTVKHLRHTSLCTRFDVMESFHCGYLSTPNTKAYNTKRIIIKKLTWKT